MVVVMTLTSQNQLAGQCGAKCSVRNDVRMLDAALLLSPCVALLLFSWSEPYSKDTVYLYFMAAVQLTWTAYCYLLRSLVEQLQGSPITAPANVFLQICHAHTPFVSK